MATDPARAALIGGGVGGILGFAFGLAITYAIKPRKTLMSTQELALLGGLTGAGTLFGAVVNAGMLNVCQCPGPLSGPLPPPAVAPQLPADRPAPT